MKIKKTCVASDHSCSLLQHRILIKHIYLFSLYWRGRKCSNAFAKRALFWNDERYRRKCCCLQPRPNSPQTSESRSSAADGLSAAFYLRRPAPLHPNQPSSVAAETWPTLRPRGKMCVSVRRRCRGPTARRLETWQRRWVSFTAAVCLSKSLLPDLCLPLQMEKTMQRLQGRFQAVSEQLESKHILVYLSFCNLL